MGQSIWRKNTSLRSSCFGTPKRRHRVLSHMNKICTSPIQGIQIPKFRGNVSFLYYLPHFFSLFRFFFLKSEIYEYRLPSCPHVLRWKVILSHFRSHIRSHLNNFETHIVMGVNQEKMKFPWKNIRICNITVQRHLPFINPEIGWDRCRVIQGQGLLKLLISITDLSQCCDKD